MASVSKLVTILEKKNVIISSAKMRWCRARELFGSQIPVTTGWFEMRISCIRSSYLTLWSSGLDNYFVCKRFAVQTLL